MSDFHEIPEAEAADRDPRGERARLEQADGSSVIMSFNHNRQQCVILDGVQWNHVGDDAAGRWMYRSL